MIYGIKKLVKELNKENIVIFEQIKRRLSSSIIEGNLYKENIKDILNMLIEGQKRNQSYKEVIGENLDEFCNEIIENSYKPNLFEKLFRVLYIFSLVISIAYIADISSAFIESFFYKENYILEFFSRAEEKVDIIYNMAWAITGLIYLISQDITTKNSLKNTKIKSLSLGILIISVYLQKSIDKINITYMVDINHKILLPVVLSIIIFYKIYNYKVLNKFKTS